MNRRLMLLGGVGAALVMATWVISWHIRDQYSAGIRNAQDSLRQTMSMAAAIRSQPAASDRGTDLVAVIRDGLRELQLPSQVLVSAMHRTTGANRHCEVRLSGLRQQDLAAWRQHVSDKAPLWVVVELIIRPAPSEPAGLVETQILFQSPGP